MLFSKKVSITFFLALTISILPLPGAADLIVLKDGTQVMAEKIWEENGLVRFSIPNYDGIVITYSKEIVERIVREHPNFEGSPKSSDARGPASTQRDTEVTSVNNKLAVPPGEKSHLPASSAAGSQGNISSSASTFDTEIDKELLESVEGLQFYSARRSYKYQTGPSSRFHTFSEAVDDLAAKFDKDPYWIGQNLGNTNDLGQIYVNLNRTVDQTEADDKEPPPETSGILFYDPRRTYKYWVANDSKHHTLNEAIGSLASQYDRSPDWVIGHLGETNDLSEIHRNLEAGLYAETGP